MQNNEFKPGKRLRVIMAKGKLSCNDLAAWFARPYPTVRSWLYWDRSVRWDWADEVEKRVKMLEGMVARLHKGDGIVPYEVSPRQRQQYIKELFHAASDKRRVPRKNTAA
jgi:hypothetical protein